MNVNQGFGNQQTAAVAQPGASVPQTRKQKVEALRTKITGMQSQIKAALPAVLTPERFTRMVFTALTNTPKLLDCTPESFVGAMMQAAQLGVEPNTPLGQAYLIPYGNQCQFQLGYKGLLDLAWRSGEITDISAHEVYEGDSFEYELGLNPKLIHKPAFKNRGQVIGYYALFHTKSGGYGVEVMSKDDVEQFALAKSQAYRNYKNGKSKNTNPWVTDFDAMAKKTIVKRVLKYAPLKSDFIRAMNADGTIKSEISENMLDIPDETVTIDAEAQPPQEAPVPESRKAAPANNAARYEEEEIPFDHTPLVNPETGEVIG